MLMAELSRDEILRYSRHLVMPEVTIEGQQKLKNARVLCVGAGGLGSPLSLYLAAVVTASFWFRRRLGTKAWKWLHYSSFAAWLGGLYHGIATGTDSGEFWLMGIYFLTSLAVVFALVVRLTYVREVRKRPAPGVSVA